MGTTDDTADMTIAEILELTAIGDAIFAEWYPNHRPGDPVPPNPPLHIMREARELAERHEACRQRSIGVYAAQLANVARSN